MGNDFITGVVPDPRRQLARELREMMRLVHITPYGDTSGGGKTHPDVEDAARTMGLDAERTRVARSLIGQVAHDSREMLGIAKAAREAGFNPYEVREILRRGNILRDRVRRGEDIGISQEDIAKGHKLHGHLVERVGPSGKKRWMRPTDADAGEGGPKKGSKGDQEEEPKKKPKAGAKAKKEDEPDPRTRAPHPEVSARFDVLRDRAKKLGKKIKGDRKPHGGTTHDHLDRLEEQIGNHEKARAKYEGSDGGRNGKAKQIAESVYQVVPELNGAVGTQDISAMAQGKELSPEQYTGLADALDKHIESLVSTDEISDSEISQAQQLISQIRELGGGSSDQGSSQPTDGPQGQGPDTGHDKPKGEHNKRAALNQVAQVKTQLDQAKHHAHTDGETQVLDDLQQEADRVKKDPSTQAISHLQERVMGFLKFLGVELASIGAGAVIGGALGGPAGGAAGAVMARAAAKSPAARRAIGGVAKKVGGAIGRAVGSKAGGKVDEAVKRSAKKDEETKKSELIIIDGRLMIRKALKAGDEIVDPRLVREGKAQPHEKDKKKSGGEQTKKSAAEVEADLRYFATEYGLIVQRGSDDMITMSGDLVKAEVPTFLLPAPDATAISMHPHVAALVTDIFKGKRYKRGDTSTWADGSVWEKIAEVPGAGSRNWRMVSGPTRGGKRPGVKRKKKREAPPAPRRKKTDQRKDNAAKWAESMWGVPQTHSAVQGATADQLTTASERTRKWLNDQYPRLPTKTEIGDKFLEHLGGGSGRRTPPPMPKRKKKGDIPREEIGKDTEIEGLESYTAKPGLPTPMRKAKVGERITTQWDDPDNPGQKVVHVAKRGDWVVTNPQDASDQYILGGKEKRSTYRPVAGKPGHFEKFGEVQAKRLTKPSIIETREGRQEANPGDYVIKNPLGEVYPISRDKFERKYSKTPTASTDAPGDSHDLKGVSFRDHYMHSKDRTRFTTTREFNNALAAEAKRHHDVTVPASQRTGPKIMALLRDKLGDGKAAELIRWVGEKYRHSL